METIIGWIIELLVSIVIGLFTFAMSIPDMVTESSTPGFLIDAVLVLSLLVSIGLWLASIGVRVTQLLISIGLTLAHLLASIGLWLAWRYVVAAQAVTDWIIARIEAWLKTRQPIAEEAPAAPEQEHDLVRALRESKEWQMLNSATSGKMTSKVAFRRLAQRFHPDRVTPENKEAATLCMQEINRMWHAHKQTSA